MEKKKILLVDDEEAQRYATKKSLEKSGFDVIEAEKGYEAAEKAKECIPDLVILDVNLPDIDGFEVLRLLKSDTTTADIPVIHLSATFKDINYKVHGIEQGADAYLVHPITWEELNAIIKSVLRMREAEKKERILRLEKELIFNNIKDGVVFIDKDGYIKECNTAFLEMMGAKKEDMIGRKCHDVVHKKACSPSNCIFERAKKSRKREQETFQIDEKWFNFVTDLIFEGNDIVGAVHIFSDITDLKKLIDEREKTISELKEALSKIKVLSGLIPICSHCKKIRNDAGYWQQLEAYITEHSDALFSHGICPDCLEKYYPEFAKKKRDEKDNPKI